MNHAARFTLVTIGGVDLAAALWLDTPLASWLGLWIAAFWLLRAGSQLYLGRCRGDRVILAGFALLAALHVLAAWG